jgi:mevalonate kinase
VQPLLASVHAISLEALAAVADNAAEHAAQGSIAPPPVGASLYSRLQRIVRLNHGVLNALGVGHARLDEVVAAAGARGFSAKLTGAGGGGCAIVLLPPSSAERSEQDDAREQELVRELEGRLGCSCFVTLLGGEGVRKEL